MIIKALVPAVVAALLTLFHLTKADDFKIIKERVVAELMKTPIDDQVVEAILARMAADGSFRDINYDDLSRTAGFPHRRHTGDLVYLAKAYKNTHSNFQQQPVKKKNHYFTCILDRPRFLW